MLYLTKSTRQGFISKTAVRATAIQSVAACFRRRCPRCSPGGAAVCRRAGSRVQRDDARQPCRRHLPDLHQEHRARGRCDQRRPPPHRRSFAQGDVKAKTKIIFFFLCSLYFCIKTLISLQACPVIRRGIYFDVFQVGHE